MRTAKTTQSGFSMLELLAVMSIAALLTTLAVTSYFSAVRGMGRRSAVKHLANTLTVARQRACMDNARVSVVLFNEVSGVDESGDMEMTPSYVICKEMGRITYAAGSALGDEYTALDAIFGLERAEGDPNDYQGFDAKAGGIRLYNMTSGGSSYVYPLVRAHSLRTDSAYDRQQDRYHIREDTLERLDVNLFNFEINTTAGRNTATWRLGDAYGVEAAPVQNLPRGFRFSALGDNQSAFEYITFLPSGRAEFSRGSIRIEETRPPNRSVTLSVTTEGKIAYNNDW
jgi:prepilin-type N-terminal cleavage/methylation domain-containing protein